MLQLLLTSGMWARLRRGKKRNGNNKSSHSLTCTCMNVFEQVFVKQYDYRLRIRRIHGKTKTHYR